MEEFIRQAHGPIGLEVEPPTDELPPRRIGFYQRGGFTLWERPYIQPPYSDQLPSIPLRLMAHGHIEENQDFDRICRAIYTSVYGCTPERADRLLAKE